MSSNKAVAVDRARNGRVDTKKPCSLLLEVLMQSFEQGAGKKESIALGIKGTLLKKRAPLTLDSASLITGAWALLRSTRTLGSRKTSWGALAAATLATAVATGQASASRRIADGNDRAARVPIKGCVGNARRGRIEGHWIVSDVHINIRVKRKASTTPLPGHGCGLAGMRLENFLTSAGGITKLMLSGRGITSDRGCDNVNVNRDDFVTSVGKDAKRGEVRSPVGRGGNDSLILLQRRLGVACVNLPRGDAWKDLRLGGDEVIPAVSSLEEVVCITAEDIFATGNMCVHENMLSWKAGLINDAVLWRLVRRFLNAMAAPRRGSKIVLVAAKAARHRRSMLFWQHVGQSLNKVQDFN
ncbi:hypothetical protein AK812_SmicGene27170 [Symbiodinium microadriaticum]|uniref:Uncharacterized protein n=1 Tax=Symbiodinium microadriaticum TaxID=2951 RepID=A0A1Q9D7Q6_SYMMI|nr:hypothetical protein AK812_SmicGene27170 [Symbiodinium microadriaticum]